MVGSPSVKVGVMCAAAALTLACRRAPSPPAPPPSTSSPSASRPPEPAAATGPSSFPSRAAATPGAFRTTTPVTAWCGPDYLRRQPDALADIDHDGKLERVTLRHEGHALVVGLVGIPGLTPRGAWTVPGDYVEVGTTRTRGSQEGDLWLSVGLALDDKGNAWKHSVYHLEGDQLVETLSNISQAYFHIDFDGDGRVDPMVETPQGDRVLWKGAWRPFPKGLVGSTLHGMPVGYGQEEAVDLDGDGDLDLVVNDYESIRIVEASTLREVWRRRTKVWSASVSRWAGAPIVYANLDKSLTVFQANAAHSVLARFADESYGKLVSAIDPAGDGSTLALESLTTSIVARDAPATRVPLNVTLCGSSHDDRTSIGPVPLGGSAPELLAVRIVEMGSPAFGGRESGSYELVALAPPGTGSGRILASRKVSGSVSVSAGVVDVDHDGTYEVLVRESGSYSNCDMRTGGGSTSAWVLLNGAGQVLWQDEKRHRSFSPGTRDVDMQAHVRPMELFGDGRLGLRVRTNAQEWYVVPSDASIPDPIPACIE